MTSLTLISSTIVLQLSNGSLISHTFSGMPLDAWLIMQRGQVKVITLGTLLASLRDMIEQPGADYMEQEYVHLLTHPGESPEVSVATSRVPTSDRDSL